MPIFDYQCNNTKCSHTFEFAKYKSDDAPPTECPQCHHKDITQLICQGTSPTIIYKTSGFHCTDYPRVRPASERKPNHYYKTTSTKKKSNS